MSKRRIYLWVMAAVWIALTVALCVSAVALLREGTARRAEHPMESVYTPEAVAEKLAPVAPLFFIAVGLTLAGLLLGVRGEPLKKRPGAAEAKRGPEPARPLRRERAIQVLIVVVAVALICAGILNGSARDVFYKAITVCTECIGLG